MTENRTPKRLMTLAYGVSIALMASYAMWLYAMGEYRDLLIPSFTTLLLIAALLMHIGQGLGAELPRIILLCCTYAVVLGAFYYNPGVPPIWLGLPITAAFLLLPLWAAVLVNLAMGPVWWLFPAIASAPPTVLLGYVTLTLLLALPRWEHARRRALLRATDPNDSDCSAYHIDTLKERLNSEYQRAAMLNQPLAVLVLHLPQLDMAQEQFGPRAQSALLAALCNEVNSRCRDHDVLGRADNATFWLVLPDTSESGALLVRERLQRVLSQCVLVETGQLEVRITACMPYRAENFERYLKRLEARGSALANA
ncbi:diguanylate cyclase domain-containing protein [Halovibrio sp. HP20-50]|uniref:diguanylate cyclase domain-containing protein n=1 Tax=Halovibrio sp. HP20-59 TaxID=3080275 RepID=UPI00294B3D5F|nr:diguanylate cyclase [Halovibrio sp. HP20-59]MEA2119307.1 diguanylate cyclase [Halovibrio sp. HP20-59]